MKKIIANGTVFNSLSAACRAYGFSYDSVQERTKKKNETAQEAFDYYLKNRPEAKKPYSEEEIEVIRHIADAGLSAAFAADVLGRPHKSVAKKALEVGIKFHSVRKLTEGETEWVKAHFGKLSYKKMAEHLQCDIRTLQYFGKRHGLTKSRSEKVATIRQYAGKLTAKEIADIIGVSEATTWGIASANRISLACPERSKRRPWTEEEDAILREYHAKEGCKSLSKRLGNRTPGTVSTRLRVLGLR